MFWTDTIFFIFIVVCSMETAVNLEPTTAMETAVNLTVRFEEKRLEGHTTLLSPEVFWQLFASCLISADYGYGNAEPDDAATPKPATTPDPNKKRPKRRCSVTKFSIEAEANKKDLDYDWKGQSDSS